MYVDAFTPMTARQFMAIRHIRNECRRWMTNDTGRVSREQQLQFMRAVQSDPSQLVVGYRVDGTVVAYGYARPMPDEAGVFVSLGVRKIMRGQGLGTFVYRNLAQRCSDRGHVIAEIQAWNTSSIRAAAAAGYRFVRDRGSVQVYRWIDQG